MRQHQIQKLIGSRLELEVSRLTSSACKTPFGASAFAWLSRQLLVAFLAGQVWKGHQESRRTWNVRGWKAPSLASWRMPSELSWHDMWVYRKVRTRANARSRSLEIYFILTIAHFHFFEEQSFWLTLNQTIYPSLEWHVRNCAFLVVLVDMELLNDKQRNKTQQIKPCLRIGVVPFSNPVCPGGNSISRVFNIS